MIEIGFITLELITVLSLPALILMESQRVYHRMRGDWQGFRDEDWQGFNHVHTWEENLPAFHNGWMDETQGWMVAKKIRRVPGWTEPPVIRELVVLQRLHSGIWFLHPSLMLIESTLAKLWRSKVFVLNPNHLHLHTRTCQLYTDREATCRVAATKRVYHRMIGDWQGFRDEDWQGLTTCIHEKKICLRSIMDGWMKRRDGWSQRKLDGFRDEKHALNHLDTSEENCPHSMVDGWMKRKDLTQKPDSTHNFDGWKEPGCNAGD